MEIIISGRHLPVSNEMKAYAEDKLQKMAVLFPKLTSARVVLAHEKAWQLVEITLNGKNLNLIATSRTEDMYISLDDAADKLHKQLQKFVEKIHDHRIHGEKDKDKENVAEPAADESAG